MGRHAEIAGAGFAGLCAALALLHRGWSVRLHERAPTLRNEGFGIAIHENGIRVLEALGVLDAVLERALRISRMETRDREGRTTSVHVPRSRTYRISRQHMVQVLAEAVEAQGGEIRTGSAATGALPEGRLRLKGGEELAADLVLAADGYRSAIRDGLGLLQRRITLGDGAMRLVIPRTPEERASEPTDSAVAHENWSGRRRIIVNACGPDEVYVAMSCPADDVAGQRTPIDLDAWTRSFPALSGVLERVAASADWTRVRWTRFEIIRLHRWSRERVAILGDAAHAMPPNLGQGGGCAMMNALALAVALDGGGVEEGLADWERRERPLTDHTQRWSRLYSATTFWPDWLRAAAFGITARSAYLSRMMQRTARHVPTGTADPLTSFPQPSR
ncbi:FAD-dependent oxidoreductase [Roseomonas sp. CCTCC AB2023176]|uniref:FAD-dependent oxidoreductase n=1 Tax=Roseomonas sp. CCTCC AB2023176 TaxID=3342640 RepID=UPI0035E2A927